MPKPTDSSKYAYMFSDDMKILQKVVVFHPHDKTKILALKRGADHKYRPNDWDLPGGNVLFGEDIIESVIREVKEESGLDVESLKPIQVRSKPEFEGGIYLLIINYRAVAKTEDVVISHEHTEYKWVTTEEFIELTSSDFLRELVKMVC
jgi:8-oxo-dGTP diphosphatase